MNRKRLLVLMVLSLSIAVFTTCKKEIDYVKIKETEVEPTADSVRFSGSYFSNRKVDEIWVKMGREESLNDARPHSMKLSNDSVFIGTVEVEPSTDYYYCYAVVIGTKDTLFTETNNFKSKDKDAVPTVTTNEVKDVTQTTATCGGIVTFSGGINFSVTARGVCWSTSENPTIGDSITTDGTGTGLFTSNITGLDPNTTYYVRAYVINSADSTGYGEQRKFTTITDPSPTAPEVTTSQVKDITQTTATCGGIVTSSGGINVSVTARGVCWSTSENPTIGDSITTDGTGMGLFTSNITGLDPNTTYYVRAYVTNSADSTGYGEQREFTTTTGSSPTTPNVTTNPVSESDVGPTTAMCSGTITNDGGGTILEYGVSYSTTTNFQGEDGIQVSSSNLNNNRFTVDLSNLQPGTTYYMRAYAENEAGKGYGEIELFETKSIEVLKPEVTTNPVSEGDVSSTIAICSGTITNYGGGTISGYGISYSTTPNFQSAEGIHVPSSDLNNNSFTVEIDNLQPGTTYFVQAYATNSAGTNYGNEINFTTKVIVITDTVKLVNQTTATGVGNVNNYGDSGVTERGICWSTSHNPTTDDSHASNGTGIGSYSVEMTSLTPNTTYYVRAYATNSGGTAYGNEKSFTTLGHAWVDLDLPNGTLWATCNVGADNPEDYGDYFAWGEIEPNPPYTNENYTYSDNPVTLPSDHDAATANWGDGWRMPTLAEFQELLDNTTVTWTQQNGVNGWLFTASNGNSLFLPAAGWRDEIYWSWSSSLKTDDPNFAYALRFNSKDIEVYHNRRFRGITVRPVRSSRKK